MSEYPGQEHSIEQLFYAVNAKILERTRLCRSSVPGPDQQHWIDAINRELHKTSANARFLENSLRPLFRLHSDIIIEISKYLDPRACDNTYKPLLHATQICRSWRDTLISHPPLWSFVSGSHPGLIPCLLDRSKHAQLDVHIISRRVRDVINHINPHIDRLSSIHFELGHDDGTVFEALRDLNAAPKLRRLNIDYRGVLLPEALGYTPGIAKPIPSIHNLQLFRFPITPELLQLRNLTVVGLDASKTTRRAVLDILSRNRLLKVVHLRGKHLPEDLSSDNRHPPGSINLPHLEVLWSEMTPLIHLEALSPPHGTRIFSGFVRGGGPSCFAGGSHTASYPIPASFSNLQGLRKLRLVDQEVIYVKLEGEKGNITYCMFRDRSFDAWAFSGIPLEEVTEATYELSPLFWRRLSAEPTTSQFMISRIVCGMTRLQKLELSCCCAKEVEYFLLVLYSTTVCRDLKILVLSHCVELYRQMRGLSMLAEGRKVAGMGLDIIRIIHSNTGQLKVTFKKEDVTRLEHAVGTLEYVEAELGRPGRSSLGFDPEVSIEQPYIFF
ncbi:hypothetical protein BDM02DRAFT_506799 [Thelephora ganbajun]|uniref:Uncharacterized protein n=1 Tax=Thelephora ganbajun TaxID=370292 RepID=A0ACB6Z791_THEGA|nr:hypothetical protein BDM02DRAFT_506799 [Thelephora ganbajun]